MAVTENEYLKALAIVRAYIKQTQKELEIVDIYETHVLDLDFTIRALNVFRANDIYTIRDLVNTDPKILLQTRCFGNKTLTLVKEELALYGVSFKKRN